LLAGIAPPVLQGIRASLAEAPVRTCLNKAGSGNTSRFCLGFQAFSGECGRIALRVANYLPYALARQEWRLQLSLAQFRRKP